MKTEKSTHKQASIANDGLRSTKHYTIVAQEIKGNEEHRNSIASTREDQFGQLEVE